MTVRKAARIAELACGSSKRWRPLAPLPSVQAPAQFVFVLIPNGGRFPRLPQNFALCNVITPSKFDFSPAQKTIFVEITEMARISCRVRRFRMNLKKSLQRMGVEADADTQCIVLLISPMCAKKSS
jgi:hypothetical protein